MSLFQLMLIANVAFHKQQSEYHWIRQYCLGLKQIHVFSNPLQSHAESRLPGVIRARDPSSAVLYANPAFFLHSSLLLQFAPFICQAVGGKHLISFCHRFCSQTIYQRWKPNLLFIAMATVQLNDIILLYVLP